MPLKAKSKLAELRKKAGLTQAQLGVLVGVTTNTIQNWEKEDGLTQLEKYLKLCTIFGLNNLKDLLEYVEISEDDQQKQKGFSFSLQELQELRARLETQTTNVETQPNPQEEQETNSLEELQILLDTQETAQTINESDKVNSSDSRGAKQ